MWTLARAIIATTVRMDIRLKAVDAGIHHTLHARLPRTVERSVPPHGSQHSIAQQSTAEYSTAQHSRVQHSTAEHSTAHKNTAQHTTTQLNNDPAQNRTMGNNLAP